MQRDSRERAKQDLYYLYDADVIEAQYSKIQGTRNKNLEYH